MHTIPGLEPYDPGRHNFLLRVFHFKAELGDKHGDQASQLGAGEVLADAAPRALQKSQEGVVAVGTAVVVGLLGRAIVGGVDPAIWGEEVGVGTPQRSATVHGPGAEDQLRSARD